MADDLVRSSSLDAAQPTEEEVVRTLEGVRMATETSADQLAQQAMLHRVRRVYLWVYIIALPVIGLVFLYQRSTKGTTPNSAPRTSQVATALGKEISDKLSRAASGDSAAANDLIANAQQWRGQLHRNAVDAAVNVALNAHDSQARIAGLEISLAANNIEKSEAAAARLEKTVADPKYRIWAMWNLGALGKLGISPDRAGKVIAAYLTDPDVTTRAWAVNSLAVLATDETVPLLLERFRIDPSPVVQERAACGIAESGMYLQSQRVYAAGTMIGWLDDATLSAQQHAWIQQALGDISGKHVTQSSDAWHEWYATAAQ
jgi:hypothetical protein